MNELLNKLEKRIIVSCQSSKDDPLNNTNCKKAIIKSVIRGGAAGLRLAGINDIKETRTFTDIPVIGITKPDPLPGNWKEVVYITPTYKDAAQIADAGADIIALDGTSRERPAENLAEIIYKTKQNLKKLVMADVSTINEGLACHQLGADIISTTLSGYTSYTQEKDNGKPDFELLEGLVNALSCPIILEGRIWTPEHVKKAFDLGAYAVVIGSAITRPEVITRRFAASAS